eukprot:CAMPEP_0183400886 /NCGR_PEP_ID=MMETSP0370-20130417/12899_1 /TAXON_ID=268820 /ORGANISM="Peridinium aciculiferum, Strain PAER-2" /LENGTH=93 /DNA_ID=CAMNT_0025582263 /DNA_START=26 /DNA_END=303 /DNA_ORIENTATION=-
MTNVRNNGEQAAHCPLSGMHWLMRCNCTTRSSEHGDAEPKSACCGNRGMLVRCCKSLDLGGEAASTSFSWLMAQNRLSESTDRILRCNPMIIT